MAGHRDNGDDDSSNDDFDSSDDEADVVRAATTGDGGGPAVAPSPSGDATPSSSAGNDGGDGDRRAKAAGSRLGPPTDGEAEGGRSRMGGGASASASAGRDCNGGGGGGGGAEMDDDDDDYDDDDDFDSSDDEADVVRLRGKQRLRRQEGTVPGHDDDGSKSEQQPAHAPDYDGKAPAPAGEASVAVANEESPAKGRRKGAGESSADPPMGETAVGEVTPKDVAADDKSGGGDDEHGTMSMSVDSRADGGLGPSGEGGRRAHAATEEAAVVAKLTTRDGGGGEAALATGRPSYAPNDGAAEDDDRRGSNEGGSRSTTDDAGFKGASGGAPSDPSAGDPAAAIGTAVPRGEGIPHTDDDVSDDDRDGGDGIGDDEGEVTYEDPFADGVAVDGGEIVAAIDEEASSPSSPSPSPTGRGGKRRRKGRVPTRFGLRRRKKKRPTTSTTSPSTTPEQQPTTEEERRHPYLGKRVQVHTGKHAGIVARIVVVAGRGWWKLDHPLTGDEHVHSRWCRLLDPVSADVMRDYLEGIGRKMSRIPAAIARQRWLGSIRGDGDGNGGGNDDDDGHAGEEKVSGWKDDHGRRDHRPTRRAAPIFGHAVSNFDLQLRRGGGAKEVPSPGRSSASSPEEREEGEKEEADAEAEEESMSVSSGGASSTSHSSWGSDAAAAEAASADDDDDEEDEESSELSYDSDYVVGGGGRRRRGTTRKGSWTNTTRRGAGTAARSSSAPRPPQTASGDRAAADTPTEGRGGRRRRAGPDVEDGDDAAASPRAPRRVDEREWRRPAYRDEVSARTAYRQRRPHTTRHAVHGPILVDFLREEDDGRGGSVPTARLRQRRHDRPPQCPDGERVTLYDRRTCEVLEDAVHPRDLPHVLASHAHLEPIVPPCPQSTPGSAGGGADDRRRGGVEEDHRGAGGGGGMGGGDDDDPAHVVSPPPYAREGRSGPSVRVWSSVSKQDRPTRAIPPRFFVGGSVLVTHGPYRGRIGTISSCIPGGWFKVSDLANDDDDYSELDLDVVVRSSHVEIVGDDEEEEDEEDEEDDDDDDNNNGYTVQSALSLLAQETN